MNETYKAEDSNGLEVAIIGMSCRVPGARDTNEFWQNLRDGVESISHFSDLELESAGIDRATLSNPNYVKAGGVMSDLELFDASLFGFSPGEARIMDPQHRIFLECAWESLENAGYNPEIYEGLIGVFAGAGMNNYLLNNLYGKIDFSDPALRYQAMVANDKDYLATRVAYKLNLKGPSVNVQTGCSSSLVAVHLACQSLLNGECEISLAGGVSAYLPHKAGYLYQDGMILSPDGHCRAFDAGAKGTVPGQGAGIVVLKRLANAIADGDCIHAVIKGSAINNDGALKAGYTAPSIDGQTAVISEAQAVAGIDVETITYVQAHGTGTVLGDPIEIEALTQAFRASTHKKGFCGIGSVKTNLGHLDAAAGVAGLIQTVLALKHKLLPPSLHFKQPNPKIDFANSPFYVNSQLSEWKANGTPRRAGVSSFGIGGTNAHLVLEEAPIPEPSGKSRPWQLLVLSAQNDSALEKATDNLVEAIASNPDTNLADIAYSLSLGRKTLGYRRILVCQEQDRANSAPLTLDSGRVVTSYQEKGERPVAFMFSGQGAQYVNMALEIYRVEPTFREQIDICAEILQPHLGLDLRQLLYPSEQRTQEATEKLKQTAIAQPAIFTIEYALSQLWMSWGIRPVAAIGHSIGEYVAACIAGVFSLEDALALVAARGKLMQECELGAMLAVSLPERELLPRLNSELSLAVINGPSRCVVSGPTPAVDALENQLRGAGVEYRRLHVSHAFHSQMMEPILASFTERVKLVKLSPPKIPYLSNVTGTWIADSQATDPNYWAKHLRSCVRFAEGLEKLFEEPEQILLEVGPGRTLNTFALQHPDKSPEQAVVYSIRHPKETQSDVAFLLTALGKLWGAGANVDWSEFYARERRYRLPLPTYPFELKRYWVEPPKPGTIVKSQFLSGKKPDIADWFYVPSWQSSVVPVPQLEQKPVPSDWLVFVDDCGLGSQAAERLSRAAEDVITVRVGSEFANLGERSYALNPQNPGDYNLLLEELRESGNVPPAIVHFWSVTRSDSTQTHSPETPKGESGAKGTHNNKDLGFYSLLFFAQAIAEQNVTDLLEIAIVSNNVQDVTGVETIFPEKAMVLGLVKTIPQEYPNITFRSIDIELPPSSSGQEQKLLDNLLDELRAKPEDRLQKFVAYRQNRRWLQSFEPYGLNEPSQVKPPLRQGGVYLITGGLGNIGLVLAEYLAKTVGAKLLLTGRSTFPPQWDREGTVGGVGREDPDNNSDNNSDSGIGRKLQKIQELEKLGAEILVVSADAANRKQMQAAIAMAEERFGPLNGVFHAAGILEEHFIKAISYPECERQFKAKVGGTLVLAEVLQDKKLDFCLLMSSLSSVLGGLGLVADAAANRFMDSFVRQHNQTSLVPWISADWDGWQFEPEEETTKQEPAFFGRNQAKLSMSPQEGIDALMRILSCSRAEQIVVSTGDLQVRLSQWIQLESLQESDNDQQEETISHSRPSNLPSSYIAPQTETEQAIADIWQKLLGMEQVGRNDNFFSLGGDSLTAIGVISRLRSAFQVNLPPASLIEVQTVAELAKEVEKARYPFVNDNEEIGEI